MRIALHDEKLEAQGQVLSGLMFEVYRAFFSWPFSFRGLIAGRGVGLGVSSV